MKTLYKIKTVKAILKRILPRPLLQQAIILRDRVRLSTAPTQVFLESSLKPALSVKTLEAIFSDPELERSWTETLQKITGVYGQTSAMGGVNPGDRRALYYLVHALQPQRLLEIGTHIGASTVFLAEALKNASPGAVMSTVDILNVNGPQGPWKELGLKMPPSESLNRLGLLDRVSFHTSSSSAFLRNAKEKFDFIFLDGDHSSRTVYEEVSLALRVLGKNGVILLHDYYPGGKPLFRDGNIIAGPFMALDRIMRENKEIKVLPLGNLPWETKQGLRSTSLALLTRTA